MTGEAGLPVVRDLDQARRVIETDPRAREQLRRVVATLDDPDGVISAFQSFAAGR